MAINVEYFKQRMIYGGAFSNKFRIDIIPPAFLGNREAAEFAEVYCRAAQMPAATVNKIDVFYQGRTIPVHGDRTFEDWTCTFYNEEARGNSTIRAMLLAWSNRINGFENNLSLVNAAGLNSYKGTVVISQLTKAGDVDGQISLIGAWPQNIGAIDLSFDPVTNIQEFQCTWVYDYFVPTSAETPGLSVAISDVAFQQVRDS